MTASTVGLYIHIPFCARKCSYCDFYSVPGANTEKMDAYLRALTIHMKEAAAHTGKKSPDGGRFVDTVYLGGGTPSLFGVKRLVKLLNNIEKLWNISSKAEITLEANPDSLDFSMLKTLRKEGFNRLSVGIQATQQDLLNTLGRIHTAEQGADCVRDAQKAGFDNISVDLMYGLPGQTAEMLFESLQTVVTWNVQHISVYGLTLEPNTPLALSNTVLPDEETQAKLYLATVDFLTRNGFEQYEISNFCRPSRHSRHNMKYWTLEQYIGFGPSAHSDFGGKRYGYTKNLDAYINGVTDNDAIIEEMTEISPIERSGEYIMLGLRTARGISGNDYTRSYRVSFDTIEERLERLEKLGVTARVSDRWRLTPKGFLLSNRVIGELLREVE